MGMSSYIEYLDFCFKALANTCSLPIPRWDFLFKNTQAEFQGQWPNRVLSIPGTETSVKQSPLQVGSCVSSALTLQVSLQQVCSLAQKALNRSDGIQQRGPTSTTCTGVSALENKQRPGGSSRSFHNSGSKARILILLIVESEIVMHHFWSEALAIL